MAQVIRKVMASSVSFSQDNREVIVGNKHLPLVSRSEEHTSELQSH